MKKIIVMILFFCFTMTAFNIQTFAATPSIDGIYTTYTGNVPVYSKFGPAYYVESGVASQKKVVSSQGWLAWDTKHIQITDKTYAVYKHYKPVNARVKKFMNGYVFVTAGSSYEYSYTLSRGYEYIYETEMATELTTTYGNTAELTASGLNYGDLSLGGKVSIYMEVEASMSLAITTTRKFTQLFTETYRHTLQSDEGSYYIYEERANFDVYVVQVYEAIYNVTITPHKNWAGYTWTTRTYEVAGYKLIEQNAYYNYIEDTSTKGFFKYSLQSNAKYIYNDETIDGIVFI